MNSGVAEIPIAGDFFQAEQTPAADRAAAASVRAFFAGPENRLAAATAERLLAGEANWLGPLWLCGPAGSGKTHLARGFARQFSQGGAGTVRYVSGAEFARQFAAAIDHNTMSEFREQFREVDRLVIDELGPLTKKPTALDELRHTLDALELTGGLAIVTSRREPRELRKLPADLLARLAGGLVLKLSLPGVAARTAIVAEVARLHGAELSDEAASQLAAQLAGSPRELMAALADLTRDRVRIDTSAVRQYLARQHRRPPRSPASIIGIVARHFELQPAQLKSAARNKGIVTARSIAMYLIRELTGSSLDRIGRSLGGRDHTTVLHNCRKVERQMTNDAEIRLAVEQLTERLQTL